MTSPTRDGPRCACGGPDLALQPCRRCGDFLCHSCALESLSSLCQRCVSLVLDSRPHSRKDFAEARFKGSLGFLVLSLSAALFVRGLEGSLDLFALGVSLSILAMLLSPLDKWLIGASMELSRTQSDRTARLLPIAGGFMVIATQGQRLAPELINDSGNAALILLSLFLLSVGIATSLSLRAGGRALLKTSVEQGIVHLALTLPLTLSFPVFMIVFLGVLASSIPGFGEEPSPINPIYLLFGPPILQSLLTLAFLPRFLSKNTRAV